MKGGDLAVLMNRCFYVIAACCLCLLSGLGLVKIFSVGFWQKGGRIEGLPLHGAELWDGLLVSLVSVSSSNPERRKCSVKLSLWAGQGE